MKITGTVRDAKTNEPLDEAKITLSVGTTEMASLYSDAKGYFAHKETAAYIGETLTCTAEKEGFKSKTLTHRIEEEIIPLEIAMEKEAEEPPPKRKFRISPKIIIGAGIGIVVIALVLVLVLVGVWWFFIREKPPLTPSDLVAKAVSSSQIDLTWVDKTDNELGFRVYRGDFKIEVEADEEGYQDKNLEPDTEYTYLVRAFNDAGESPPSNEVRVSTPSPPPQVGTIAVSSTPSGASIYLNNQPKGTTTYSIPSLSPGTYTLRVDKTGYRSYQQSVTVKAGKTTSINIALKKGVKLDAPVVEKVASRSHPAIPSGLKAGCSTCPVIKWGGYTYWAYSHRDNRVAMTIVAYDAAGKVVRKWYKTGARYVGRIGVDTAAKTVTFWGQADKTIVMKWDELRVPGS